LNKHVGNAILNTQINMETVFGKIEKKMTVNFPIWNPGYAITPEIARDLMSIESAKTVIDNTPFPPVIENELRRQARVKSTHYSTQIEGNRLTLKQAEEVIREHNCRLQGRERDVAEVRNYWKALISVEEWATKHADFNEGLIKMIHGMVMKGRKTKPSDYRGGQNVIRDSNSGRIVYMPPEAKDVPGLMKEMVRWFHKAEKEKIPAPIIAALVHYQFVTIHPYYDGNGRTARLMSTFIIQRSGYGLHGFFSMEEHHAKDVESYYKSLSLHPHHNYYFGRAEADLTPWLKYFISLLAAVFLQVKDEALRYAEKGIPVEHEKLRRLERRSRTVLSLFLKSEFVTAGDVASVLGLSNRTARLLIQKWVEDGFFSVANSANRSRKYRLSATYRQFIGK
jgi:Fic family protein